MKLSHLVAFTSAVMAIAASSANVAAEKPQFRETITVKGVGRAPMGSMSDHHLTFSAPVALPHVELAAGSYVFRRLGANVLQVLSADGRRPYAMVLTSTAWRADSIEAYQIVLREPGVPGGPRRIDAWFVPRESTGQQMIYRDR